MAPVRFARLDAHGIASVALNQTDPRTVGRGKTRGAMKVNVLSIVALTACALVAWRMGGPGALCSCPCMSWLHSAHARAPCTSSPGRKYPPVRSMPG